MKKYILIAILLPGFAWLMTGCYYDDEVDLYPFKNNNCDTTNITYSQSIASIMSGYCNVCHNAATLSGNVQTDNYDGVKVVVDNGKLWKAVNWEGQYKMPNGGSKLSDCDLKKIKKWIDAGAPNN